MATLEEAPMHEKEAAIMEILDADEPEVETEEVAEAEGEPEAEEVEVEEEEVSDPDAEEESEDDEPNEEDEDPVFTVKVRGEEQQVKLQELRDGYSRTEDYKAKTAEVAEMRRAVEAEKQNAAQTMDMIIRTAHEIDPILAEGNSTDWGKLADEDPIAYVTKKAAYDQRIQQLNSMAQQRDTFIQKQTQDRLVKEEEALLAARPEWSDPEVGNREMTALRDNLASRYGFSPEEVKVISDHRIALVADDARKYHELVAQQEKVKAKKTTPAPTKHVKPSRKNGASKSLTALKVKAKSGSFDDKVAFITSQI